MGGGSWGASDEGPTESPLAQCCRGRGRRREPWTGGGSEEGKPCLPAQRDTSDRTVQHSD
jgi:hypothetical protein